MADQWAVMSPDSDLKGINYIQRMPFVVQYFVSIIFASVWAVNAEGLDGLGRLWNPRNFIRQWPMTISSTVADVSVSSFLLLCVSLYLYCLFVTITVFVW